MGTVSSGTKLEAVEVPASGASYNPSLEQHQELLWKAAMVEIDTEKVIVGNKPKTRRQLRDQRKRMFEDQKKARSNESKLRETEVTRIKSIRKELKSEEEKKAAAEEKLLGPARLSNYKYEPQELEIKLSD